MNYKEIRRNAFYKDYELSKELMSFGKENKDHSILANPTALLGYTYLMNYVRDFSTEFFQDSRPLNILDWGCGRGYVTVLLRELFPNANIVSCDVANELAQVDSSFGQQTPIIEKHKIDVVPLTHPSNLPFESGEFDIVLSVGVLEHVPDHTASLAEINRVLRKDGLFFCFYLPYYLSWTQRTANLMGNFYHDHLYNWKLTDKLLQGSHLQLLDRWHRCLFPKNFTKYPFYRTVEKTDISLCENTFLKHLATNIEFVAKKG